MMVREEIGIKKKKDKKTEDADMGFGDWGGYMASKRAKLLNQFCDAKIEEISNIFKGIAIHVNGLTKPPIDVLKNLMAAHGGLFHAYQTSSTTHIIASNLANVKIKKLGLIPIVKPSWITDSIDMKKLLDYSKYLLYTNQSISQPALRFPIINGCHSTADKGLPDFEKQNIAGSDIIVTESGKNNDVSSCEDYKNESHQTDHTNKNCSNFPNNSNPFLESNAIKKVQIYEDQHQNSIADNTEKYSLAEQTKESEVIGDKYSDKILDNRQRTKTKTAADPNFLEEFYSNSRLHLISTLGAEYKQLVNQLRQKSNGKFPELEKLKGKENVTNQNLSEPVIMHIDMDCFFVSVGLRNHPEFKGKPVAITHARNGEIKNITAEQKMNRQLEYALYNQRLPVGVTSRVDKIDTLSSMSEIASCSYEARSFGVRNGMFLGQAIKMCPDLKMLPYDFESYKEVSRTLYSIIASYTLDIEAVSCDEMYVDVTKILNETGLSVEEWADYIRNEITRATRCPCSTGFGSNRLQARLATRKAKPAGKFYLKNKDIESFMADIPLTDLPGVGRATLTKLHNLKLNTCGDIQSIPLRTLQNEIGSKLGETLKEQAMGIDKKPLNFSHERKSVSAEVNFGIRFKSLEETHNFLQNLSTEVYKRLRSLNMKARCVTLKLLVRSEDAPLETAKFLGHGICDSLSKSSMNILINDSQAIFKEVLSLYNKINPSVTDLRGIGIQLSKLEKIAPMNSAISRFLKQPQKRANGTQDMILKSNPYLLNLGKDTSTKNSFTKLVTEDSDLNCTFMRDDIEKNQIESDVLEKLPEELRCEVITHCEFEQSEQIRNSHTEKSPTNRGTDCQSSPFSGLNWEEMKPLIRRWANSGEKPQELDIIMIGKHFKAYALDGRLELLFTILNSLHRMVSYLTCEWHNAYFTIVNIAQEGMMARYGNTIMINRTFKCCYM